MQNKIALLDFFTEFAVNSVWAHSRTRNTIPEARHALSSCRFYCFSSLSPCSAGLFAQLTPATISGRMVDSSHSSSREFPLLPLVA
jgi:hypothetical protein